MKRLLLLLVVATIGSFFYQNCSDLPLASCDSGERAEAHKYLSQRKEQFFDQRQDLPSDSQVEDFAADFEAQNQCDLGNDYEAHPELEKQVTL